MGGVKQPRPQRKPPQTGASKLQANMAAMVVQRVTATGGGEARSVKSVESLNPSVGATLRVTLTDDFPSLRAEGRRKINELAARLKQPFRNC